ncbi:MAG: GAF domain-containing protein, partial [Candidatus Thorarchaeota archaeon]
GTIDFIYRFIIFAAITYLVYTTQRPETVEKEIYINKEDSVAQSETELEFKFQNQWHIADLINSDEKTRVYLKDQLEILINILIPDHAWIFYKKNKSILKKFYHKGINDTSAPFQNEEIELLGIMQILNEKDGLLIENNLTNEGNLINFYQDIEYTPASFLGIPINIYNDEKFFFVFDSHNKQHFNHEDEEIINKIVQSIRIFLLNRVKAYSLLKNLNENEDLLAFAAELNGSRTISLALDKAANRISNAFEASRLTISLLNKESHLGVIKKVIGQKDAFNENNEFPLDEGLTGWIMSKNKPYIIDDLEKGEYFIPRYTKVEKNNFGLRSFLGIPIEVEGDVFGAITLEHHNTNQYSEEDKDRLQKYMNILNTTFRRQKQ